MDAKDLTVELGDEMLDRLLLEWQWLLGPQKLPLMVTALGDVFVQDQENGEVLYLNTASADLMAVADSVDALSDKLADERFINEYFAPDFVAHLQQAYGQLPAGYLYGFQIPEQLGGEITWENMEIVDIQRHFSEWGRIHQPAATA